MSNNLEKWANKSPLEILKELEITEPPFNPFIIAKKMGVNVKKDWDEEKLAYDGEIYLNKDNIPEIWINPSSPQNRQNFTMAHELGHLVFDVLPNIDKFKNPILDDYSTMKRDGSKNSKEFRANNFASALLLPKIPLTKAGFEIIQKYYKENQKKIKKDTLIEILAKEFEVSEIALTIRVEKLGLL